MKQEAAEMSASAAKAAVYATATASFLGYSLQEWVYITAIMLAVLQITFMLVKGIIRALEWWEKRKMGSETKGG